MFIFWLEVTHNRFKGSPFHHGKNKGPHFTENWQTTLVLQRCLPCLKNLDALIEILGMQDGAPEAYYKWMKIPSYTYLQPWFFIGFVGVISLPYYN